MGPYAGRHGCRGSVGPPQSGVSGGEEGRCGLVSGRTDCGTGEDRTRGALGVSHSELEVVAWTGAGRSETGLSGRA